jgi:Ca2+/H+ antiporter
LVLSAGLTGLCGQFLVTAVGEMVGQGMSQQFVGLILLPIIGNAAEVKPTSTKFTFSTWKLLKRR